MNCPNASIALFVTRWAARLSGAVLGGLMLFIIVGESISEGPPPLRVWVNPIMLSLLTVLIGIAVGWKREGLGGTLIVCALAIVNCYHRIWHGGWLTGGFFLSLFLPGILLLLTKWQSCRVRSTCEHAPPASCSS